MIHFPVNRPAQRQLLSHPGFYFLQILAVGLIDLLTGHEISFSIFYLAPVITAAWFSNRMTAYIMAVTSAVVWLFLDIIGGSEYSHPVIPFWNAGVRLGFFLITGYLTARLKWQLDKEKEKIESELGIAHEIQMSLVPTRFPPFPDPKGIGIYAQLEPARQIGGDFYDFFFMDPDHLFFCIGDVSDKGVSAALLMAKTLGLFKILTREAGVPSKILALLNTEICAHNDAFMFVSAFCGVMDIRTGKVDYANAGHNPPLCIGREKDAVFLPLSGSPALGIDENSLFHTQCLRLNPGDCLFLYTDGLVEAFNARREMFGEEGLKRAVSADGYSNAEQLVKTVLSAIDAFTDKNRRTDDIAVLAIRYEGRAENAPGQQRR